LIRRKHAAGQQQFRRFSAAFQPPNRSFSAAVFTSSAQALLRISAGFPHKIAQHFRTHFAAHSRTLFLNNFIPNPEPLSRPGRRKMGETEAVDQICGKAADS
jgi:hypothetical protein